MSEGKRLFLTSLQQTCNEYLYLNINKCELAFLLQKPSSDSLVICFREACLVTMIHTPEPEHGALRHRAQCSETLSTVLWDTDHGTLRHWAQCSETQTTVLWDTEHSALRHRPRCSETLSKVLWDTDHGALRHWAQCSETQSTVLWEPEHTGAPCSPRAHNLLYVLISRIVGYHDLCSPVDDNALFCFSQLSTQYYHYH